MNKFKEVFCEIPTFLRKLKEKRGKKNHQKTTTHPTEMQYIQSTVSGQTVKYLFIWEHVRHVTQTLLQH